ncbi:hypothetical protein PVAND_007813 [Polypedilum vanderplanki]|uniref:DUF4774 domain-containing protein n=1 Tax=Polypedilum vanderplanki TaxID=319348 RepID=A0A9J6C7R8_POLVA|nr:hypothetical protein PVAND_007813 [Polypedilum vanderplanki]
MQQRDPRAAQFSDVNLIAPSFYSNEFHGTYSTYKGTSESQQNNPPTNARKRQFRKLTNMDIKYVQAVQQPNAKFNVKEFAYVSDENKEQTGAAATMPLAKVVRPSTKNVKDSIKSQKLQIFADNGDDNDLEERVKVESIGMSSADQPLPDYSPYFPQLLFPEARSDESTLILEPNSKAVSGNDGISISTPLSRALLRRGSAVKLLFRPQSVAISGAGGTSHAQADLIVDFIDE